MSETSVIAIEAVGRKMSGGPEVGLGIRQDGPMFTLDRESHHAVAVFTQNQRDEVRDLHDLAGALPSQPGMKQTNYLSFSSAVSRVKTSPSPANAPDSKGRARASFTNSHESQESLFAQEDTFWSRTSRVFLVPMPDGTSVPSSLRWPTSGFTISPGEFSTPNSSEYPNVGGECSSLRDVLEADVAPKYFLSQRAAAGILRRAQKRGKALPAHLEAALRAVGCGPTSTDTEPTS